MEERLTPKKASAIINILRDKLCKELSPTEMEALIIAENVLRKNPEITEKYIYDKEQGYIVLAIFI